MKQGIASLIVLTALGASHTAYADIWTYVDAKGVRHYSNIPNDPRFVNLTNQKTGETRLPNAGQTQLRSAWA